MALSIKLSQTSFQLHYGHLSATKPILAVLNVCSPSMRVRKKVQSFSKERKNKAIKVEAKQSPYFKIVYVRKKQKICLELGLKICHVLVVKPL